jgi:hypothetical protein
MFMLNLKENNKNIVLKFLKTVFERKYLVSGGYYGNGDYGSERGFPAILTTHSDTVL